MASNTTKLTFAGIMALAFVGMALTMTVSADVHDRFGEQVVFGDADFLPTLDDTAALEVCIVTFGENNANDWAFYLKAPHNVGTSEVERDDVRLSEYEGSAPGTLVRDQDTVEVGQSCANTIGTVTPVYGDVNNNNRYDNGDYVWLTSNTGDDFDATDDENTWTLRLTDTDGGNAGSPVFSGDTDNQNYGSNSVELVNDQVAFHNVDRAETSGGDDRLTNGDHLYLAIPYQDATATVGELTPLHSIRIHGPGGAFGSQVDLGDDDYVALLNEIDGGVTEATNAVCAADLEGDGLVEDMGVYLHLNTNTDPADVDRNMLRLTETPGGAPGSLVRSADTTESGIDCEESPGTGNIHYADRNNNGRYDEGDWVFLATSGTDIVASSGPTAWTIRLTDTDAGDAGTFVMTGDSDLTTYQGDVDPIAGGTGFGILDRDRSGTDSADRVMTRGDSVYVMRGAASSDTNQLVPVYSIRLTDDFGTQVMFGDDDFRPTLDTITTSVCVVELGDDVQDFGFYLQEGSPGEVERHAVRLVEAQGNPAGSTVQTGDTSELGQTCEDEPTVDPTSDADPADASIHYTDLNNNNRYDEGDGLYIVFDDDVNVDTRSGLVSSSGSGEWTIRLSGDDPGTLVFSGDSDHTSYNNDADLLENGEVHHFDADLRGEFSRGDTMYISAAALGTQELVVIHSVRVTGELPVTAPPPAPPTDDDAADDDAADDDAADDGVTPPTDDDAADDDAADDDTTTPPPADDDDEAEEEPTPGPAAIVLLVLVGGALVALRRRK